jgi:hypothetical protein
MSNLKQCIMSARPLFEIASEIKKDWVKPNYAAKPYLDAKGQKKIKKSDIIIW